MGFGRLKPGRVFIDTELIDLKEGIKLFGDHEVSLRLDLLDSRKLGEATTQRHYRVLPLDKTV